MADASAEMRAYYAARAPYYDAVYLKPERAKDIAFLFDYLPAVFAGRSVLEVACGTGYWTQHIAGTAPLLSTAGRPSVRMRRRGALGISYRGYVNRLR